jgi:hypothetical protein
MADLQSTTDQFLKQFQQPGSRLQPDLAPSPTDNVQGANAGTGGGDEAEPLSPSVFEKQKDVQGKSIPCLPEYTKLYKKYKALKESENALQVRLRDVRSQFESATKEVNEFKGRVNERVDVELRERKMRQDKEVERANQMAMQATQKLQEAAQRMRFRDNQIRQLQASVREMASLLTRLQADRARLNEQYERLKREVGPEATQQLEKSKLEIMDGLYADIDRKAKEIVGTLQEQQARESRPVEPPIEELTPLPQPLPATPAPPAPQAAEIVQTPQVTPPQAESSVTEEVALLEPSDRVAALLERVKNIQSTQPSA